MNVQDPQYDSGRNQIPKSPVYAPYCGGDVVLYRSEIHGHKQGRCGPCLSYISQLVYCVFTIIWKLAINIIITS